MGEMMDCPVCFASFPLSDIEAHVNSCLESCKTSEPEDAVDSQVNHGNSSKNNNKDDHDFSMKRRSSITEYGTNTAEANSSSVKCKNVQSMKKQRTSVHHDQTSPSTMEHFFTPKRAKVSNAVDSLASIDNLDECNNASVGAAGLKKLKQQRDGTKPLAEQMRPETLEQFVGQEHILSHHSMLRRVIQNDEIPSMILWGPPGCGKTSLANIIALQTQINKTYKFVTLSATNAGVTDVKEIVKLAKNDLSLLNRKTILFIDEIHRFNKLQQDVFLPCVESGTITLVGATTENPSFSLNSALLSRCRVFVLEKLTAEQVECILRRAIKKLNIIEISAADTLENGDKENLNGNCGLFIEKSAVESLAHLTDGDARIALNCLHLSLQSEQAKGKISKLDPSSIVVIADAHIKESLQRTHLLYDRKGDEHYNCISALHKSMRGSDADAALYWLGRILVGGEDPRYVARRLVRFASEDIGMADPFALNQAVAAYEACQFIGMPECDVVLAQCVVYLSKAPKSVQVYSAYCKVKECIASHKGPLPGVPLHLRNAPTKLMKDLGYAKDYKYNPVYSQPVDQEYLPECLKGKTFLVNSKTNSM